MYQIFLGSLLLSIIHASIPNHWIPIIAIGKSELWTTRQTMLATIITGFAHTISTVIIGFVVGFAGYKLSSSYGFISNIVAPFILFILGTVYIFQDISGNKQHQHQHQHHHDELDHQKPSSESGKLKWTAILTSLSIAMFLTPCIEIEAYYFQAGTIGWPGIFIVSVVYTLTTVIVMLLLVFLGMKGLRRFNFHFLEHHEKSVTGSVLCILGLLAFFVKF
jgi:nickel/cobalt transporter (NicO) family protein